MERKGEYVLGVDHEGVDWLCQLSEGYGYRDQWLPEDIVPEGESV